MPIIQPKFKVEEKFKVLVPLFEIDKGVVLDFVTIEFNPFVPFVKFKLVK